MRKLLYFIMDGRWWFDEEAASVLSCCGYSEKEAIQELENWPSDAAVVCYDENAGETLADAWLVYPCTTEEFTKRGML